jgi:endonuclease/exonuclease/phosphatase family metal-dependent hydrolase
MIKPYYGRVILTDKGTRYPDASDHNAVLAKIQINPETKASVMTFNVRLASIKDPRPYDWTIDRDHECAQLIDESGASVVAVQECEPKQDEYFLTKLPKLTGDPWKGVSVPSNVGLFYKSDRWQVLTSTHILMDNGAEADRRFVVAQFQSVKTGAKVWIGSTHFGVGVALAERRRHQARRICEFLKNLPGHGDVRSNAVVMGDFNDWAHHSSLGVRKVFFEYGFLDLPARLSDADYIGDSVRTNHPWGKPTIRDGRQIDAIFTRQ